MLTNKLHREIPGYEGLYSMSEDMEIYDHRRDNYSTSKNDYFALRDANDNIQRKSKQKIWNYLFTDKLMKKIPGKILDNFSGYIVQEDGQIYSLNKSEYLVPGKQAYGKSGKYRMHVTLVDDNGTQQSHRVHRIVAMAYIPNPENKSEVNHIDGDPSNNHVSNLEWSTRQENMQHAADNYLFTGTQKGVRVTKLMTIEVEVGTYGSMQQAANELGLGKYGNANISETCTKNVSIPEATELTENHKPYTSGGYVFRYMCT